MSSVKIVRYLPLFVSHSKTALPTDTDNYFRWKCYLPLMLCSMALFTLTKYYPHWIFHLHDNLSFGPKMTLSPLQLWRYNLFTFGMFFPEKNFSPDIENGMEYRSFSRNSVEVRKSSIVTDNPTRNAIVIIQLELKETWKLKKTYLCYYLWHLVIHLHQIMQVYI